MQAEFERVFQYDLTPDQDMMVVKFTDLHTEDYSIAEIITYYPEESIRLKAFHDPDNPDEWQYRLNIKESTGQSGVKEERSLSLTSSQYHSLITDKMPVIKYTRKRYFVYDNPAGITDFCIDRVDLVNPEGTSKSSIVVNKYLIEIEFKTAQLMMDFVGFDGVFKELNTDTSIKYKLAKYGSY